MKIFLRRESRHTNVACRRCFWHHSTASEGYNSRLRLAGSIADLAVINEIWPFRALDGSLHSEELAEWRFREPRRSRWTGVRHPERKNRIPNPQPHGARQLAARSGWAGFSEDRATP